MEGISVAYSGVHQAYQLALAAHEAGLLERFYCSLFVATGKWGGRLAGLLGQDALINRACSGLPPGKVLEHPWPLLRHRLRSRFQASHANNWFAANDAFDRWVARNLPETKSRVFVGVETSAEHSFVKARERD